MAKLQAKVDPTTSLGDAITQDVHDDAFPPSEAPNTRTNAIYYKICSMAPKHLAYTDLTGRFPYRSSRGNQYIMVAYSYDSNAILAKAINNRSASSITSAWKYLHDKLHVAGVKPETWVLDNETSNLLTTTMKDNDTTYQLVPPHIHRANLAERAIQTFKDHLKAGLASLDPDFPLCEWDRILDQCILTLNLLRSARLNPKLSAHAFLFGQFDYNKTPIAPPGIKVIAHKKPSVRGTWAPNGEEGWYVGPAPLHYRCMTIYFPKTRAERQTDTLTFFPHHISVPEVASIDFLKQAALDIISILSSPVPSLPLSLEAGDTTKNALLKIAEALGTVKDRPVLAPNPTQLPRVQVTEKPTSCSPRVLNKPLHNDTTTKVNPTVPTWKPGSAPFLQTKYNLRSRKVQPQATQSLLAQHIFSTHTASHIYNSDGHKETINSLLFGPAHEVWQQAMSNEWGRLAQGNDNGINFTDTIDFIHRHDVPSQQKVTYGSFVCNFKPLKKEQYRIRLVAGGDILMYDEDTGAPAASLIETKLLINSVISDSDQGAQFLSCDLKDFFLATPMEKAEYMKVQYKYFPSDIRHKYNLQSKVTSDGYIFIKIKKGMYGLKQAAVLAFDNLVSNLNKFGYYPVQSTTGIWRHKTRRTTFCLCVDDFGVKYLCKNDADHLLSSLQHNYEYTVDWTGNNFCGLTMYWQYDKGYVDVSMPKYIPQVLERFKHKKGENLQYSPHQHVPIKFGAKRQYAIEDDNTTLLDKNGIKYVQQVVGSLLYYARAIDSTILPALNTIGSEQAKPKQNTKKKCVRLLDYVATYPNAFLRFHSSDMQLIVNSDAAYLVLPGAKSRIAGYFRMGDESFSGNCPDSSRRTPNAPILVECKTL